MSFWGAYLPPRQPYTLQLDSNQKRLRISKATLGDQIGVWASKARSSLQCAVGSKPSVYICSLSLDYPCIRMDLLFEQSEDVVFTVKGPRGIHLSGYYVSPGNAEIAAPPTTSTTNSDGLRIDCCGKENRSMTENQKEKRLNVEEKDIGKKDYSKDGSHGNDNYCSDSFIGSDLLVNTEMKELHDANVDLKNLVNNVNKQLLVALEVSLKENQRIILKLLQKNMTEKGQHDADKGAVVPSKTLTDSVSIESKEMADATNQLTKNESKEKGKAKIEGHRNRTLDVDIAYPRNELAVDQVLQAQTENSDMCQDCPRIEHGHESSPNMDICIPPILTPHEVANESKERGKDEYLKVLTRSEDGKQTNDKCGKGNRSIAENDKVNKLTVEEEDIGDTDSFTQGSKGSSLDNYYDYNDSFIDNSSVSYSDEMQELHAANVDQKLVNNVQQQETTCRFAGFLERELEGYVFRPRRPERTAKNMIEKDGDNADNGAVVHCNILEDGKTVSVGSKEKADMVHRLTKHERQLNGIAFFSKEIGYQKNYVLPSTNVSNEDVPKSKKMRKDLVLEQKSVENDCANSNSVLREEKLRRNLADTGNMAKVLPESNGDGKTASDKNNDIYSHLVVDEPEKEFGKKKKHESKGEKNECAKSSQLRTSSNGLTIEVLAAGEPDGEVAALGRNIKVFYTAKLLNTGTVVDSNLGEAPYKFRLGDPKIIEGWNVGIKGMRTGAKRRLTIPPSMCYGRRGGQSVPQNSWLLFDVELVEVG